MVYQAKRIEICESQENGYTSVSIKQTNLNSIDQAKHKQFNLDGEEKSCYSELLHWALWANRFPGLMNGSTLTLTSNFQHRLFQAVDHLRLMPSTIKLKVLIDIESYH